MREEKKLRRGEKEMKERAQHGLAPGREEEERKKKERRRMMRSR
jgi:hypothetical protein